MWSSWLVALTFIVSASATLSRSLADDFDPVLSHNQFVLNERSGVRLALYHGGYGSGFAKDGPYGKNSTAFAMYLQNIVSFVKEKHIDKVFISIQDPYLAVPILQHVSILVSELMVKLPPWVELGALVATNPKYPWKVPSKNKTEAVSGGLSPLADHVCTAQPSTPNATKSAALSCQSLTTTATDFWCDANCNHNPPFCPAGTCKCSPATSVSCKPASALEAVSFCGSDSQHHVPAWTQKCGNVDPCEAFSPGSYCQGDSCHGLPSSAGGDASKLGPCDCPPLDMINDTVLAAKPWCPNSLEIAVELIAALNTAALAESSGARIFTSLAWDKEDFGVYGSAGGYLKAWRLMRRVVLPTFPSGYRLWHNAHNPPMQSLDELATLIRIGDAGEGSKNPDDNVRSVDCQQLVAVGLLGESDLPECVREVAAMADSVEAYPEQYWYTKDLKEQGCIGCPHGSAQLWSEEQRGGGRYGAAAAVPVTQIHQCDACLADNGTCAPYFRYFMPLDHADGTGSYWDEETGALVEIAHYDACVKGRRAGGPDGPGGDCPKSCCDCLGCIPCAYDAGGEQPNMAITYQQLRNSPAPMAAFIKKALSASGVLELLQRSPNRTWTMFSLETAHDWDDLLPPHPSALRHSHTSSLLEGTNGGSIYNVSGAGGRHECISRQFGGDTCGTFDGFGTWEWPAFLEMLLELRDITGLDHFAIYEVQWLPPQWFDGGAIPFSV